MLHIAEDTFVLWIYSIPFFKETPFIYANGCDLSCILLGAIV